MVMFVSTLRLKSFSTSGSTVKSHNAVSLISRTLCYQLKPAGSWLRSIP